MAAVARGLRMKFQGVGTWRNGDEGAQGGERAIEGGERRAGQASRCSQGAFHRRRPHSATYTVYPQHEYQWGPPKIQPFFLPYAAATRPACQPASAARARPCSVTDLSCLECKKSACCPLPATQLSHKPMSVLRVCVCVCLSHCVCILKHAGISALFLACVT